eukprot:CAMPEP_0172896182 /NCGR_PEP_ID=MMETSP1075-20121228/154914_1 /TAXON_ID=2916 /ORGANISM="Ceratium fusus, Strain PA161109" /LENGTH=414 /DNA_ID=CAMNT_0013751535 /DNA_START=79 /DNA_END=1324 /DNA_ORIENTATION=-
MGLWMQKAFSAQPQQQQRQQQWDMALCQRGISQDSPYFYCNREPDGNNGGSTSSSVSTSRGITACPGCMVCQACVSSGAAKAVWVFKQALEQKEVVGVKANPDARPIEVEHGMLGIEALAKAGLVWHSCSDDNGGVMRSKIFQIPKLQEGGRARLFLERCSTEGMAWASEWLRWLSRVELLLGPNCKATRARGQVYRVSEGGQDTRMETSGKGVETLYMTPQVVHADPRHGARIVSTATMNPRLEKGCDFYLAEERWSKEKQMWVDSRPPELLERTAHVEYIMADELGCGRRAIWVSESSERRILLKHQPYVRAPRSPGGGMLLFIGVFDYSPGEESDDEIETESEATPRLYEDLQSVRESSSDVTGACLSDQACLVAERALLQYSLYDQNAWPRQDWLQMKATQVQGARVQGE